MTKRTDAYGKLEYLVGNDDYFLCFDYFIREDGFVELETAVNSEIGGFVDTYYLRSLREQGLEINTIIEFEDGKKG